MPKITVELPTKEFHIMNAPSEKSYIFSVHGDMNANSHVSQYFTVLDEEGKERQVFTKVTLAYQDIANRTHQKGEATCYYLAGYTSRPEEFLGNAMSFVALVSYPSRTGRWIVIERDANLFVLPGNYILEYLDRAKKVPTPMAVVKPLSPVESLKGAVGKHVRLVLKDGSDWIEGAVGLVGEHNVQIDTHVIAYPHIKEVIFTF